METESIGSRQGHLLWVYADSLQRSLDAATWLETTRELERLGWRVTLVTEGPVELKQIDGVRVHTIPKPNIYLVRQVVFHVRLLWLVLNLWSSLDIVLFHQMSAPWLLSLRPVRFFFKRSRPLFIMDTRTVPMIPTEVATRKDRLRNRFDRMMNAFANRWADGQTAITERMAHTVGVPRAKLLGTWSSGVVVERFTLAAKHHVWPTDNEPVQLIYVGALHHPRNLLSLCKAVLAVNADGLRFQLTLVGDGTAREDLEAFASLNGSSIQVLPPVPHAQIPDILARAHVGVLPFPDEERFRVSSPIKLFEYMAAGLAVFATRISCHTDVVRGGSYAFWSESGSVASLTAALHEVWRERQTLSERGTLAAAAASEWSWHASARKLSLALGRALQLTTFPSTDVSTQEINSA